MPKKNTTSKKTTSKKSTTKRATKSSTKGRSGKETKPPIFLTALVIIALLFAVGGFFTFKILTKEDEFVLIGDKNITLNIGDEYIDAGAKVISFGRDYSEQIEVESNVDTSVAGDYFVKYTIKSTRFKNVVRYRYVIVEEVEG